MQVEHREIALLIDRIRDAPIPGMHSPIQFRSTRAEIIGSARFPTRPVEPVGRLRYIDGCTDSLLIPPQMLGDPCLNALYFPAHISQTEHTHPSPRIGLVARGSGECHTREATHSLFPGLTFIITADGKHRFSTTEEAMIVVAYHPDSDYGPTHETHPMINRTIVQGVSASQIELIRTREDKER